VHVQLKTASKLFGAFNVFGADPNSQICPNLRRHPGVLPLLNKRRWSCWSRPLLAWDARSHRTPYSPASSNFYPDFPRPIRFPSSTFPWPRAGHLDIVGADGKTRAIRIHRIHLEEDAGKLMHAIGNRELDYSLVDLNRAGISPGRVRFRTRPAHPRRGLQLPDPAQIDLPVPGSRTATWKRVSALRCQYLASACGHTKLGPKPRSRTSNSFKA